LNTNQLVNTQNPLIMRIYQ